MLRKYQEHSPGGTRHLCMLILLLSTLINSQFLFILHRFQTLNCLPHPPGIRLNSSSFNVRNEPPDSATSSPMLRTKNNYMAGVDLVRTSLPVQQERIGTATPPAYREPVDSLAIYQDTFRASDGEYSANEMLTLAHKYR